MPLVTLARLAFTGWSKEHYEHTLSKLHAARSKNEKAELSLWGKSKDELVVLSGTELGMNRAEAMRRTAQELRAELKEARDAVRAQTEPHRLPVGMGKMTKAQLVEAMQQRGLTPDGLTNANMMRRLRLWEAAATFFGRVVTEQEVLDFALSEEYTSVTYTKAPEDTVPAGNASTFDSTWTTIPDTEIRLLG